MDIGCCCFRFCYVSSITKAHMYLLETSNLELLVSHCLTREYVPAAGQYDCEWQERTECGCRKEGATTGHLKCDNYVSKGSRSWYSSCRKYALHCVPRTNRWQVVRASHGKQEDCGSLSDMLQDDSFMEFVFAILVGDYDHRLPSSWCQQQQRYLNFHTGSWETKSDKYLWCHPHAQANVNPSYENLCSDMMDYSECFDLDLYNRSGDILKQSAKSKDATAKAARTTSSS